MQLAHKGLNLLSLSLLKNYLNFLCNNLRAGRTSQPCCTDDGLGPRVSNWLAQGRQLRQVAEIRSGSRSQFSTEIGLSSNCGPVPVSPCSQTSGFCPDTFAFLCCCDGRVEYQGTLGSDVPYGFVTILFNCHFSLYSSEEAEGFCQCQ